MQKIACKDLLGNVHMVAEGELTDSLHAYGVFVTGNKVLLIQDSVSGRWEFPGGRIEEGETTIQGIIREVLEETGAVATGDIKPLTDWIEYFFDIDSGQAWRAKREFYTISNIEGELLNGGNGIDSIMAKLVPANELDQIDMTPPIRQAAKLALDRLQQ